MASLEDGQEQLDDLTNSDELPESQYGGQGEPTDVIASDEELMQWGVQLGSPEQTEDFDWSVNEGRALALTLTQTTQTPIPTNPNPNLNTNSENDCP